jgi:hypothetical protein
LRRCVSLKLRKTFLPKTIIKKNNTIKRFHNLFLCYMCMMQV